MGKSEMKKNILFVYTNYSTFVKTDFGILSEKHEVVKYQFKPVKGLLKTALPSGKAIKSCFRVLPKGSISLISPGNTKSFTKRRWVFWSQPVLLSD